MKTKQIRSKIIVPLLYSAGILLIVLNQLSQQNLIRRGGDSPMFVNLMEHPAYARKGFDIEKVTLIDDECVFFNSPPLRIADSSLPDLPKRRFLSPAGHPAEEFTIIISAQMDNMIDFMQDNPLVKPGMYLSYIGDNWEIYVNGILVQAEMHLDETGQIESARTWRSVFFPVNRELFVWGENIITLRIIGDPASTVTGLYYTSPYYIDDYKIIEERHHSYIPMLLCGVFGFTGIYYLVMFLIVRKKEEIFNLYYSLFSMFLCIYNLCYNRIINYLIPNSDISVRLEYTALFLLVPMLCFFIEMMGRNKITKISRGYLIFCIILVVTQVLFCTEYGNEVLMIWTVTSFLYFAYVFFYDIIYFYFWERRKSGLDKRGSDAFINILIGSVLVFCCGIYDMLDVLVFHNALRLFLYSTFVFHIGMAFTLSSRFRSIYNRLEHSNIMLQQKTETVLHMQDTLLTTMAEMVEHRDDITGGHIERTKRWMKLLLEEIEAEGVYSEELKELDINLVLQSCQLHDVGKITITDNILRKPGKLDNNEYEEMKKHTIFGEHIIGKSERHVEETDFLKYAKVFAVSHHEKWDGTGYPYGLHGTDIPLLGRIMAIADVYDALISVRPYKPAYSHEEAVRIINEGSGTQFDPLLVEVFNHIADKFKE